MPELLPVQSILFQNLLRDFQIIAPPRVPVWWMSDVIQPVAIVNSQITLEAKLSEDAMLFATAGVNLVPAAADILADTGALDVGTYLFRVYANWHDTSVSNVLPIQHRDAANAANNWAQELYGASTSEPENLMMEWTEAIAQDERIRVLVDIAGGGGSRYNAIIWRRLLT